MSFETRKQIFRHITQEGFSGNFAPLEVHPGMQETLNTLRHVHERTSNQEVVFLLQFGQGDWLANLQRIAHTPTAPIFGRDTIGKRIEYEVLQFCQFEGDTIVKQHSQADSGSIMARAEGDAPEKRQYTQTGNASQSPDDACTLIRQLIEAAVAGNYVNFEHHPTFKGMIPEFDRRRAMSSTVSVSFPLQFSDGEWVATRTDWQEIAKGERFGVDATGKQLEYEALMIHRIENGSVVDGRGFSDILMMRQQLGIQV